MRNLKNITSGKCFAHGVVNIFQSQAQRLLYNSVAQYGNEFSPKFYLS